MSPSGRSRPEIYFVDATALLQASPGVGYREGFVSIAGFVKMYDGEHMHVSRNFPFPEDAANYPVEDSLECISYTLSSCALLSQSVAQA